MSVEGLMVVVEVDDVEALVREQLRLHRNLGIQDVYKLLFQGVMGVAHILRDKERSWRWIVEEFEGMEAEEFLDAPLLERVSVDGGVVRVNLRPFKRLGLSLEGLFGVMVVSAERIREDKKRFVELWKRFMGLVRVGRLDFDYERLIEFDGVVRAGGYPPVHHSREYAEANKPAYRIAHKQTYKETFG
jgi:hypothetical protein